MMPNLDSSECPRSFFDRHIHGIAGVDFATNTQDEIRAAVRFLAARGTTRVIASLPSVELAFLSDTLDRLGPLVVDGVIAGVHLEGPFLAHEYAGAHPLKALLLPDSPQGRNFCREILFLHWTTRAISMMTVAPELPGFDTLVQTLVSHGIQPALGHTAATYEQMGRGIETVYGLTQEPVVITHVYNAMRSFHHRDPGPLFAVLEAVERGRAIVEMIGDGFHVDLRVVTWWLKRFPGAVRLVSDASAATLPPGVAPLSASQPMLGHVGLSYPDSTGPSLSDGSTLASGGKDLLQIHDDLVGLGVDHDVVCAAMQA